MVQIARSIWTHRFASRSICPVDLSMACPAAGCHGALPRDKGCKDSCCCCEKAAFRDLFARGGGPGASLKLRERVNQGTPGLREEMSELRDLLRRSEKGWPDGEPTLFARLSAGTGATQEDWRQLGRPDVNTRAFDHDCGSPACLHGIAIFEPEMFKE